MAGIELKGKYKRAFHYMYTSLPRVSRLTHNLKHAPLQLYFNPRYLSGSV